MKMRDFLFNMALCLLIVFATQFKADASTAIATVGPNTPNHNIVFTGGTTGTFNLSTQDAFARSKVGFGFNPNVSVKFTQLKGIGAGGYSFNAITGIWHLILADPNGVPSVFEVVDNATGNTLLIGEFQRAILHGRTGSSSLALTLEKDSLGYGVPSLWFPGLRGTLSVSILSRPTVRADANGPADFAANGDINFGAL